MAKRPRTSQFDRYKDEILEYCNEGLSSAQICEALNEKHGKTFSRHSMNSWFAGKGNVYNEIRKKTRETIYESTPKQILDILPAEKMDKVLENASNSLSLIEEIRERYGLPGDESEGVEAFLDPLNVAYQSFMQMARAIMIIENKQASILEVRAAQNVYWTAIKEFQFQTALSKTDIRNIVMRLNPGAEQDPSEIEEWEMKIRAANESMRLKNGSETEKEQMELFTQE